MASRIMDNWESLRKGAISPGAGPDQIREMRRAFFAGAAAMQSIMMRVSEEDVTEDEGAQIFQTCLEEVQDFTRRVQAGEF